MRAAVRQQVEWFATVWVCIGLSLALGGEARAASPSEKLVLTLEESIKMAVARNPQIKEAEEQVNVAQSKVDEVEANRYPQIDAIGVIGPSPRARGNHISSPDDKDDIAITNVFTRIDATIIQPLYTFGKITSGIKAAMHGVNVDKARVKEKSAEIIVQVQEFYYGLLLARDLRELLTDARKELNEALQKIERLLDEGSEAVSQIDLFKFNTFAGQLDTFITEAEKSAELALSALKMTVGVEKDADVDIAATRLVPVERSLEPLTSYVETSRELRPEFTQLAEGLEARKALITVAKRDYYPNIFLGGIFAFANADNRTDIENPFIHDPFNEEAAAVVLGFKWSLNFATVAAKVDEAQAEYRKLLAKKEFAEAGIPVQVEKAYREALQAKENMAITESAYQSARKWLVAAQANFDLGIGEAEEIAKAYTEFLKMRAENFRAIYNYNLALAQLDQATGLGVKQVD